MKKEGWQFASHSWGHINMTTASVDHIKKDTALWQKEVQPIVGKTPVLIFPFGADIGSFTNYTNDNAKYTYLKSSGFSIFDNVDASKTSWGQLTNDYYRNARINVDGIRLHETMIGENTVLNDFFNTKDFYHRDK
ncbi:polysaccharide deacetylase family protein [Amylolactobacillus amylophilus]|nr:polysaccharide deacetylase family protein [Amylolactobacillus amylophilus]